MTLSIQKNSILIILAIILAACSSTQPSQDISLRVNRANSGDAKAQFELANSYDYGYGIKQDHVKAAFWYQKAAEQNYAEAQNSLASLFQSGLGVPKDNEQAFKWYQKAADQGHPEAINNLAYLYDLGLGVSQDRKIAFQLYQLSAEKGFARAMLNLGISYYQGIVEAPNYVEAYKWLDLARFYTQHSKDMELKWRARGALDEAKNKMTTDQIREGDKMSKEWYELHH